MTLMLGFCTRTLSANRLEYALGYLPQKNYFGMPKFELSTGGGIPA